MSRRPGRRSLLAIGALIAIALIAPASASAGINYGARPMKPGMRGHDISVLQKFLTRLSLPTKRDAHFGRKTKHNVKRLEARQKWKRDGKVDRKQARRIRRLVVKLKKKRQAVAGSRSRYYFYGAAVPTITLTGTAGGSVDVDVLNANGVRTMWLRAELVAGGGSNGTGGGIGVGEDPAAYAANLSWYGRDTSARPARDGVYRFAIRDAGATGAKITGGQTTAFQFRRHIFPVRGAHYYGGAGSIFGAPRAGHTHQGHDLAAACGTPLVAAQGGTVVTRSYQASGAGHYVVIKGKGTGKDYVYMHLKGPGPLTKGQAVRTGKRIGRVGNTGSSSGCHLHFERWTKPGWYSGGRPFDPLPTLRYWDTYS